MPPLQPDRQRAFALEVLNALRAAGHDALWAGGCVRDQLLGRQPKDYDVATSATPDEIRQLFGRRRTLAIGAAFGVISVLGEPAAGQIEVATFRSDVSYSDGRHPDRVVFSGPQQDAERRDFTINGLFFDPMSEQVIDYVGGVDDLNRHVVRAIGDAHARFTEDKLRMLRAVRFAATFNFTLEGDTEAAIRDMAAEITVVSPERIAMEMRAMLVLPNRAQAQELLLETGLLAAILPEAADLCGMTTDAASIGGNLWQHTLRVLSHLHQPSFALALAALLHAIGGAPNRAETPNAITSPVEDAVGAQLVEDIGRRWRLSSKELDRAVWLVRYHRFLQAARIMPWPVLQRMLITDGIQELLDLHEADALAAGRDTAAVDYCRALLHLPAEELNPPPLITGDDLIRHGVPQGKVYKTLLDSIRDAQLEKTIHTKQEALALVDRLLAKDNT